MSAIYAIGDVFDRLAEVPDGSVDLIVTSPPYLALRSYLPADHPDKAREIGSERTPAEFLDVMLRLTAEWRRVLAPHGSIAIELGDTYAGSGGAGGDYAEDGLRDGQPKFRQAQDKDAWPLPKSLTMIPELFRVGLAYGVHPLTGEHSPAGRWRVRNVVRRVSPNPPPGALGDKWRPATSEIVVACTSGKRYWDDVATRRPSVEAQRERSSKRRSVPGRKDWGMEDGSNPAGAPLNDWWEIASSGYDGAHYATFSPQLVEPFVKAMGPRRVCRTCGGPSRRQLDEPTYLDAGGLAVESERWRSGVADGMGAHSHKRTSLTRIDATIGWSDCGHGDFRPGLVLDPFAGTGTTLAVATGHGLDALGFDLDERNADLALERVGPLMLTVVEKGSPLP